MKFTRRPDLDPQTRIHIVMLAWLHQGVYGKMTQIANYYRISRTFLYQLLLAANLQLEGLFSDEKLLSQTDHQHLEQLLLLLRLEGKCSLLSISSILKALHYHPDSLGYLSQFFHSAGQALPSTLLMPSKKLVFYLSDEIFAIHAPILVTIDAQSTAILNIELASDRSAETWRTHFEDLANHHFFSLGMASDRGKGVVAGYQAACDMALWVADYFHEFRDLFEVRNQWERKAYAAINKEYEAARRFAKARSESNLQQRLQQYDTAHRACEQAITLYDQLDVLLDLLRDAFHICSPHGTLRTPEGVRADLTRRSHKRSSPFAIISMIFCSPSNKPKPSRLHSVWWSHTRPWISSCWPGTRIIEARNRGRSKSALLNENETSGWRVPTLSLTRPLTPSKRGCSTSSTRLSGPLRSSRWSMRSFVPI
jgi:hypothetical protein